MAVGFKRILLVPLAAVLLAACWRSAGIGADAGDTESDTLGGITDPDTGFPGISYEWSLDHPVAADLSGVFGFSSSDALAVGDGGTILRFDGSSWDPMTYPPAAPVADLAALWGSAPWDVFAVGSGGAILHYDGDAWSLMGSGTDANLHDVCGRGPDDVYAVGDAGTLLVYDGSAWSALPTGVDRNLFAAWCAPGSPVYAAGHASDAFSSSVLLRYDGGFVLVDHPIAHFLYALGGAAADAVFIGGAYQAQGEELHAEIYRSAGGASFAPLCANEELLLDLFAVGAGELWAVGQTAAGPAAGRASITHAIDGQPCAAVSFDGVDTLRGVWRDPGDPWGTVFAVGDGGAVLIGVPEPTYGA